MAHPNDETLGFSALMIAILKIRISLNVTLINVTHSNINTSDISKTSHDVSSTTYRTFCYYKNS